MSEPNEAVVAAVVPSSLSRILVYGFWGLIAAIVVYSFAMNMHYASGLPYWDDWQYFFGAAQGLHVPLTWESLWAKEADYVAPLLRVVGHGLWQLVGADFLALRLLMWVLFAAMLAAYARLLWRCVPQQGWAGAAAALALVSTTAVEYFYYQHMPFGQPLFFILFFACLYAAATKRWTWAALFLCLSGTLSIFGASYALGLAGYAMAQAVADSRRRGRAAFAAPRFWLLAPLAVALAVGIGYLTFAGSYVNHTGHALAMPWRSDFWVFTLTAFAAALGFAADLPTRYVLPLGLFGLLLYVVPALVLLLRRPADERGSDAAFVLGSLLAGTVIITLVTAAGRTWQCGADLAAVKSCGATARYVYPIVVALPAAVLAAALCCAGRRAVGFLAALAALAVPAAGYGLDRQGQPSLVHWDFSPMNRMITERDAAGRHCLADYLARAGAGPDGAAADFRAPLICPPMWGDKNIAPYLKTAYETGAPFLPALLARSVAEPVPVPDILPGGAAPSADGRTLLAPLAVSADIIGHVDRAYVGPDGVLALTGWAADGKRREPAAHVVAVSGDRVVAAAAVAANRDDVAAALQAPRLRNSGFVLPLPGLTAEDLTGLRVFAVTRGLQTAILPGPDPQPAAPDAAPATGGPGSRIAPAGDVTGYADGRPANYFRLDAQDAGPVLRHGDGPDGSDRYGARDAWVFRHGDDYYLHYDAAGPDGWLAALAVSRDGVNFTKKGPILALGAAGEPDSASASYGVTYFDGRDWHMFYLGTPNASAPPARIPAFPYQTLKARSDSPAGPWIKQPDAALFRPRPGTYYNNTASPGAVIKHGDEYLQFFSAAMPRTLGIARARDLNGPWTADPQPILPPDEQIENAALYFQESTGTWFLFTNHVGLRDGVEFTDAIWVYWSQDPTRWSPARKAVVLDGRNAVWSKNVIGLPSVLPVGDRLAIYYDGLGDNPPDGDRFSHMGRDVGLAWLDLPIALPAGPAPTVKTRLLDAFDPAVAPPPTIGSAADLPDARCFVERINQGGRSDQPVPVSRTLSVGGWTVMSGRDGVAASRALLALQPAAGGAPLYVQARREPRADVKAHFGRPDMAGDLGFAVNVDLDGVPAGVYRLDILQWRDGVAYPCGVDQPVAVR